MVRRSWQRPCKRLYLPRTIERRAPLSTLPQLRAHRYEHVRGFLRAIIYGEDEAALASKPERGGALTERGGEDEGCFLKFDDLVAQLDDALESAPREVQSFRETARPRGCGTRR